MNISRLSLCVLTMAAFVCFVGCGISNRAFLRKYQTVPAQRITTVPKAVKDDVQSYIHSAGFPAADISWIEYFEDGTGGHAVVITQELPKSQWQDLKSHVLYYDKDNVRTRVRVYSGNRRS